MKKNYLFIAGCPRSGTSALVDLLCSHSRIIIGMERYAQLYKKENFKINKELFTEKRFLNVLANDTFYNSLDKFYKDNNRSYLEEGIINKFQNSNYQYVGDKKPEIYKVYDELFNNIKDAKVIFIYRDVYDVAMSWNDRLKQKKNWPLSWDYKKAISEWNLSLELTLEGLKKYPNQIVCIKYEDLFNSEKNIHPLYKWLGLDFDSSSRVERTRNLQESFKLEEKRKKNQLSFEVKKYCDLKKNYDLFGKIEKINLLN